MSVFIETYFVEMPINILLLMILSGIMLVVIIQRQIALNKISKQYVDLHHRNEKLETDCENHLKSNKQLLADEDDLYKQIKQLKSEKRFLTVQNIVCFKLGELREFLDRNYGDIRAIYGNVDPNPFHELYEKQLSVLSVEEIADYVRLITFELLGELTKIASTDLNERLRIVVRDLTSMLLEIKRLTK